MVTGNIFGLLSLSAWMYVNIRMAQSLNEHNDSVCCKPVDSGYYDAFYDFNLGSFRDYPGITVVQRFVGTGCSTRGVLKLTFNKDLPSQQRMLIDIYVDKPQGWVFNLGDSSTNNGWGGDERTQSRDAELHLTRGKLSGFYDDFHGSGMAFEYTMTPVYRVTCLVGNEYSVCLSDCDTMTARYFTEPGWFALDGQEEQDGPVNYDLYLGINGVINMKRRLGSGVCKIGLKFVPAF
nr:DUF4347 domain-containing protein [Biomphalaria glabrata]